MAKAQAPGQRLERTIATEYCGQRAQDRRAVQGGMCMISVGTWRASGGQRLHCWLPTPGTAPPPPREGRDGVKRGVEGTVVASALEPCSGPPSSRVPQGAMPSVGASVPAPGREVLTWASGCQSPSGGHWFGPEGTGQRRGHMGSVHAHSHLSLPCLLPPGAEAPTSGDDCPFFQNPVQAPPLLGRPP